MNPSVTRRDLLVGTALTTAVTLLESSAQPASARTQSEKTNKMKLGMVTYNVAKDWTLPTLISHLKAAGWEGAELRTTHAHGVEVTLGADQRKEVKQRFTDAGVALWGYGTVCEFHSPDANVVQKHIEDCKRWCELAKDTGAKGVKVRPNGLQQNVPVEKTLEQIGKSLIECGKSAADNGVEIWVEVHGGGTQLPANMKKIMEFCGHPKVGICWNSNGTDLIDGSVKPGFQMLKPYLLSCHINDLWGNYPYRDLFQMLREANYDRFTLCEVGTPVPAEGGVPFMKCYRGLWKELMRP